VPRAGAILTRRLLLLGLVALVVLPGAEGAQDARSGGIFRVSFQGSGLQAFDYVDPALAYTRESWTLLDTVCARLMRYRDRSPPEGYQLVPEVAAAPPTLSADLKTWTFKLRSSFRFSDGRPVRADAFAQAIHRSMAPDVDSPAWLYTQAIAGADDVKAGRAARASGVTARDLTLTIRLTRPVGDLDAWTTMPFFCAVPPSLPPSREGVRTFPAAGPYVITEYRPDQRITLRRNPHYGGNRTHHVDGYAVDLSAATQEEVLDRIEAGKADWGYTRPAPAVNPSRNLIGKYGIDHEQFFIRRGLTLWLYVLNSSRPLFRDNPKLRRAVNLALNRFESSLRQAEYWTDQFVPPLVPGYKDQRISPPEGDLDRATALAAGNLRGGRAVLYAPDFVQKFGTAQLLQEKLAEIGLDVEIRKIAEYVTTSAYLGRLGNADEPWDIALVVWSPDFVDASAYLNRLFDTQSVGGTNLSRFEEDPYLELMRRADRLRGASRAAAYAALDLQLGLDAAPAVPMGVLNEATLVSRRTGCLLLRPSLVLTTVCLKR
jgi:ABC-type oligopeptide transport system substrate-binding subunit